MLRASERPPAGAVPKSINIHADVPFTPMLEGEQVIEPRPLPPAWTTAVCELPLYVAVSVGDGPLGNVPRLTGKVALVVPPEMVTDEGTLTYALLVLSATTAPIVGAPSERVTVHVAKRALVAQSNCVITKGLGTTVMIPPVLPMAVGIAKGETVRTSVTFTGTEPAADAESVTATTAMGPLWMDALFNPENTHVVLLKPKEHTTDFPPMLELAVTLTTLRGG